MSAEIIDLDDARRQVREAAYPEIVKALDDERLFERVMRTGKTVHIPPEFFGSTVHGLALVGLRLRQIDGVIFILPINESPGAA